MMVGAPRVIHVWFEAYHKFNICVICALDMPCAFQKQMDSF